MWQKYSYECNFEFCEKIFATKSDFMKQKKNKHITRVKKCENYTAGTCQYSSTKCWFVHEHDENENYKIPYESNMECEDNKISKIMEKLKSVVEKYTEQIIPLD